MNRWSGGVVLVAAIGGSVFPSPAYACSCFGPGPPCQDFWQADAVFAGRVEAITDVEGARRALHSARRVSFRIAEAYRGVGGRQVEVFTGSGGGDCGYRFRRGETYVVYAYRSRETGRLHTGICSRTTPLRQGADDIAYARSAQEPPTSVAGRIVGSVRRLERDPTGSARQRGPMPGVRVTATANGVRRSASTDASGRYEIDGLGSGEYAVHAEMPPGLYATGRESVSILDIRGCAQADFHASYDGRVQGWLVDASGRGVGAATLELWVPERVGKAYGSTARSRTDDEGRYELVQVPPGRYFLTTSVARDSEGLPAQPRLFYPGVLETQDATLVEVGPGTTIPLRDFVAPDSVAFVTIAGVVRHADGSPAAGAKVYLKHDVEGGHTVGLAAVAAADGRFTQAVVAGARFRVVAELQRREGDEIVLLRSDESLIVAATGVPRLDLVLRRAR